jgi:hypothetical protein
MLFEKYKRTNPQAVIFRKVLTGLSGNFFETIQNEKAKRIPTDAETSAM